MRFSVDAMKDATLTRSNNEVFYNLLICTVQYQIVVNLKVELCKPVVATLFKEQNENKRVKLIVQKQKSLLKTIKQW